MFKNINLTFILLSIAASTLLSCNSSPDKKDQTGKSSYKSALAEARSKFTTKLTRQVKMNEAAPTPPDSLFSLVKYPGQLGAMDAYLGKIPADGKLHPAVIWITGGFGNDIGEVWEDANADNDQTAAIFRKAGLVMLYPTQRGGNMSPGYDESAYSEIDDIIAARDFLAKQPGIDSSRIYLGGHSTGGTKVLLVAEMTNKFRAVFSFGPVADIGLYGPDNLNFNISDRTESSLRSPGKWIGDIVTPTFVFEGTSRESNIDQVDELRNSAKATKNSIIHFHGVRGFDHFSALQPASMIIAKKIVADTTAKVTMEFNEALFD